MSDSAARWLYDSSDSSAMDDRREHVRYDLSCEIQVVSGHRIFTGVMENISLGGARLALQYGTQLSVGESITCVFTPSASLRINLDATVRWVEDGGSPLAGIMFRTQLHPEQLFGLLGREPEEAEPVTEE